MRADLFWKVLTVVLVVTNSLLIYLLVSFSQESVKTIPSPPKGIKGRISKTLLFDESQDEAFKKMAHEHHLEMRKLSREQSKVLRKYFNQLHGNSAENPDQEIFEKFNALEAEKLRNTYQHFLDIKAMCNDEQKQYFEDALDDMLDVVTSGDRKPPRRGPPPRHPPF